jgi:hypothetical protein
LKVLDKDNRLFGIVNPIDALVVVAAVVAVVIVANVLFGVNPKTIAVGHGSDKIEMVVKAGNVSAGDISYLKTGDKVIKFGGSKVMGSITGVTSEPSELEAVDNAGVAHVYRSKLATDVYITVQGTGQINSDGAFIGDEQVRVNMLFDIAAPTWQAEKCRIVSLKVVK